MISKILIKLYLGDYQEAQLVYNLIVKKILHICNLIKNLLYRGRSNCSFPKFLDLLEDVWGGSGYSAFRVCAFVVIFTLRFHFYIFRSTLGSKFRSLTKNQLHQQDEAYGSRLVKFVHSLSENDILKHERIENTTNYNLACKLTYMFIQ